MRLLHVRDLMTNEIFLVELTTDDKFTPQALKDAIEEAQGKHAIYRG